MQMCGACIGAILAAFADPYLAGYATNVIANYACGGWHGATGNVSECCARFNCDVPGSPLAGLDQDDLNLIPVTGTEYPTDTYMWGPAVVVEVIGTFMLCITVLLTAVYKGSVAGNNAPIAIGLSVFFAHLIAIPITNCSINPARTFGAAVALSIMPFMDENQIPVDRTIKAWEQMWFFWVFPILGGLFAAMVFYLSLIHI